MTKHCIDCEWFQERTFFPRNGGTSGKCYNPISKFYGQWRVGAWGCEIIQQQDLFNQIK